MDSPSLDEEQCYEALQLLHRFKSVFAHDISEIKECKGLPLTLELHTHQKMFKRQFCLSDTDRAEVARHIKQMEDFGVIEPSDTPYYNSPIFLAMKKNGSKRLEVNLKHLQHAPSIAQEDAV